MIEMPCRFSILVSWSRIGSRTASVFPDPVGAMSRTFVPPMILGMATDCGGVGEVNPDSARASWIVLERFEKTCSGKLPIVPELRRIS